MIIVRLLFPEPVGWLSTTNSTRVWEPTLSGNQFHSPPLVDRARLSLASAKEMRSLPPCSITLPAPSTLISIGCTTKFARSASTKTLRIAVETSRFHSLTGFWRTNGASLCKRLLLLKYPWLQQLGISRKRKRPEEDWPR
jgi:hypothetical protein